MFDRYASHYNFFAADLRYAPSLPPSLPFPLPSLTCLSNPLTSLPPSPPPSSPSYRNEPHGLASWGESSPLTDYNHYYERLINRLAFKYPDWKVSSPSLPPSLPPSLGLTDQTTHDASSPTRPPSLPPSPQGLWLVEGTQYNNEGYEPPVPQWWGGRSPGGEGGMEGGSYIYISR